MPNPLGLPGMFAPNAPPPGAPPAAPPRPLMQSAPAGSPLVNELAATGVSLDMWLQNSDLLDIFLRGDPMTKHLAVLSVQKRTGGGTVPPPAAQPATGT